MTVRNYYCIFWTLVLIVECRFTFGVGCLFRKRVTPDLSSLNTWPVVRERNVGNSDRLRHAGLLTRTRNDNLRRNTGNATDKQQTREKKSRTSFEATHGNLLSPDKLIPATFKNRVSPFPTRSDNDPFRPAPSHRQPYTKTQRRIAEGWRVGHL